MVRRSVFRRALAALALAAAWAGPATAAQMKLTGDVDKDFPMRRPGFGVIVDNPIGETDLSNWNDVAQAAWITDQRQVSGWNIKDIRTHYDAATDSLAVGVNFFGVAGDADGDGLPGRSDPRTTMVGGADLPHLGGRETIAVAFDLDKDRIPDVIAGVPADKSVAGPGIDGFTVAKYKGTDPGLSFAFGETLPSQLGGLLFDPSAEHPDFEFVVANFSKIPGFEFDVPPGATDFHPEIGIQVLAGTPDDIISGEDTVPYTRIAAQAIPEPASVLGWAALAGAAAWRLRRRRAA
jgi:hypothetical protein